MESRHRRLPATGTHSREAILTTYKTEMPEDPVPRVRTLEELPQFYIHLLQLSLELRDLETSELNAYLEDQPEDKKDPLTKTVNLVVALEHMRHYFANDSDVKDFHKLDRVYAYFIKVMALGVHYPFDVAWFMFKAMDMGVAAEPDVCPCRICVQEKLAYDSDNRVVKMFAAGHGPTLFYKFFAYLNLGVRDTHVDNLIGIMKSRRVDQVETREEEADDGEADDEEEAEEEETAKRQQAGPAQKEETKEPDGAKAKEAEKKDEKDKEQKEEKEKEKKKKKKSKKEKKKKDSKEPRASTSKD